MRTDAGVFDVSHMGEFEVEGPRARDLLQSALSNDVDRIQSGEAQYTLLTNEDGGIVDDLIVYRLDECRYLLVVNAANREIDFEWLKSREIPAPTCATSPTSTRSSPCKGPRAIERLGLPARRKRSRSPRRRRSTASR